MIGNPFNYTIELGQLLGVDAGNPGSTLTFNQMTQAGLISGSFAFYNTASQGYEYIANSGSLMLPNVGYWVYVSSVNDVTLVFPPVLIPGARAVTPTWTQSENNWRLQLVARNNKNVDAQNYVGVATSAVSKALTTRKPPTSPGPNAVSLEVQDMVNGKTTQLAQSYRSTGGNNQAWNIQVTSKQAGPVTVTWPNLKTVPADVQFRLTDTSTGATRDLRRGSGYTFTATENTTRTFKVEAVPGVASKAAIANVVISRTKGLSSPVNVTYALATDATVSVQVLSNGRAIYQAVAARADHAGSNSATWNLRDSANRQVAPGQYQIEIVAEGADGQRVRRTVPVTVTR
jgi:hypothetical protein